MLRTTENIINAFIKAIKSDDQTLAKQYIANHPRIFFFGCAAYNQALHNAAHKDHINMATWLISLGATADLLIPDERNRQFSLLQHLVKGKRLNMVRGLLPFIININHTNDYGKTALHYAIDNNDLVMCELLQDYNASYAHSGVNRRNVTVDTQIDVILKEGKVDIAKLALKRYPQLITEYIKKHPNIISYICRNSGAEHKIREDMIRFLITEFPETLLAGNSETIQKQYHDEINRDFRFLNFSNETFALLESRKKVNSFFLTLTAQNKLFINKKLELALAFVTHVESELIANDLVKALKDRHPIINADSLNKVFREILFTSPPNPRLYTQLGRLLVAACNHLLKSAEEQSEETQLLCKLTLLLLMRIVSNSDMDLYREIANLMRALNPAITFENVFSHGNNMNQMNAVVADNLEKVEKLVTELKGFYCNRLNVKLTEVQANPCSAIESMIQASKIRKLQLQNLGLCLKDINTQRELTTAKAAQASLDASNTLLQFANGSYANEIARLHELLDIEKAKNLELGDQLNEVQDDYMTAQITQFDRQAKSAASRKTERNEEEEAVNPATKPAATKRHRLFDKSTTTSEANVTLRRSERNRK